MSIILMGNTGTGKSSIGRILSFRTGYSLHEVGYVVKGLYLKEMKTAAYLKYGNLGQSLEYVSETFRTYSKDYFTNKRLAYANELIKTYGKDYFVRVLMKLLENECTIIIGPRSIEEINAIKEKLPFPFFVGLKCEDNRLVRRFVSREYEFMAPDKAKRIFEKRRDTENSWGVENVLHLCNIVLSTDNRDPSDSASIILTAYNEFMGKNRIITDGMLW